MRSARVPSQPAEIARLYWELGRIGARADGEKRNWGFGFPSPERTLALASQSARYDPRLLWIAVDLVARRYDTFNPLTLRRELVNVRWPGALGVVFEFARSVRRVAELDDVAGFVMKGIAKASGEQFFVSTYAFASTLARREAEESLAEYKRWGFLSREAPIMKELGARIPGTLESSERMNILRRLAEQRGTLSLADYLGALRGGTSRRQASRDLAAAPFLTKRGVTRAARYEFT